MAAANSETPPRVVGIGLDLSLTYGTASLALSDGTYQDIAFVQGDISYRSLFNRWTSDIASNADDTKAHVQVRSTSLDRCKAKFDEAKRRLRTYLGLASTHDIAVLADMISLLRKEVETHLGHSIQTAVPTVPRLAGVLQQDLEIAMSVAGLNLPSTDAGPLLPDETTSASVRYRLGFCTSRETNITCTRQSRNVLTLFYSATALHIFHQRFHEARDDPRTDAGKFGDWLMASNMGFDARLNYARGEEAYWNLLRNWMHRYIKFWSDQYSITDIVLLGEFADQSNFTNVVQSARAQIKPSQAPFVNDESPLFDAARGAADLHASIFERKARFEDDSNAQRHRYLAKKSIR
ncbi:hypothetical protein C1H76_9260 [Elsinoe australis]|uniref:Uncharacterized protein n=1 Tax=Elsinoe australis TaxID=40998 RepID=A0A4U7APW6_9PEZI|nr:hypothetical protein C1H76_9260 [Elsinoe australis]